MHRAASNAWNEIYVLKGLNLWVPIPGKDQQHQQQQQLQNLLYRQKVTTASGVDYQIQRIP